MLRENSLAMDCTGHHLLSMTDNHYLRAKAGSARITQCAEVVSDLLGGEMGVDGLWCGISENLPHGLAHVLEHELD